MVWLFGWWSVTSNDWKWFLIFHHKILVLAAATLFPFLNPAKLIFLISSIMLPFNDDLLPWCRSGTQNNVSVLNYSSFDLWCEPWYNRSQLCMLHLPSNNYWGCGGYIRRCGCCQHRWFLCLEAIKCEINRKQIIIVWTLSSSVQLNQPNDGPCFWFGSLRSF